MRPTLGPKERLSRRIGQNLFLKGERSLSQKHAMIRNPFPPGMHGRARRRGMSDFGTHLKEKQKMKYTYGIAERQLRRYFEESRKKVGNTAEALYQKLEFRLDNAVYRAGFTISRTIARHTVSHGHFYVNGKRVDLPSYGVKKGDVISIAPQSAGIAQFKDAAQMLKQHASAPWLSVDKEKFTATVNAHPQLEEAEVEYSLQMIVESYSR